MRWLGRTAGRSPAVALAALGVAVLAGACGSDSDPGAGSAEPGAGAGGGGTVLTIEDFAFRPEPLTVPAGTVVKVVNEDDAPHTATADDDAFDTGELGQGGTAEITLPDEGEIAYHCSIHDYMRGVIRVTR